MLIKNKLLQFLSNLQKQETKEPWKVAAQQNGEQVGEPHVCN